MILTALSRSARTSKLPSITHAAIAVMVITLAATASACGDGGGGDDGDKITQVFVGGKVTEGAACPPGTTKAYQAGHVLVCHECADDRECVSDPDGKSCKSICGPGCENDSGDCCPARTCLP